MATTPTTTGATPVMRAMASKPLEGFPPIVVPVGPGLQSPGDTVSTQGKIEVDAVELGGRSFGLSDGLSYDVALTEAIRGAVLGDLPFVVLCREDCKGLCPTCGCNLNEETCDCAERRAAEVDPMSPFSALASFSFDEGDAGGR